MKRVVLIGMILMLAISSYGQTHRTTIDNKQLFSYSQAAGSQDWEIHLKRRWDTNYVKPPNGYLKVFEDSSFSVLIFEGSVVNHLREGTWKAYYRNGKPESITHFKNGKLNGTKELFTVRGQRIQKENYKNGFLDGEQQYYEAYKWSTSDRNDKISTQRHTNRNPSGTWETTWLRDEFNEKTVYNDTGCVRYVYSRFGDLLSTQVQNNHFVLSPPTDFYDGPNTDSINVMIISCTKDKYLDDAINKLRQIPNCKKLYKLYIGISDNTLTRSCRIYSSR